MRSAVAAATLFAVAGNIQRAAASRVPMTVDTSGRERALWTQPTVP